MSESVHTLMTRPDIHPGIHPFLRYRDDWNKQSQMELREAQARELQQRNTEQLVATYKKAQQIAPRDTWELIAPRWVIRILALLGYAAPVTVPELWVSGSIA